MSHDPGMYGAQRSLLTLLSGIDRSVITPLLVNPGEGSLGRRAAELGIPVFVERMVHWIPGTWVLSSRKRRLKHTLSFFWSLNRRCRAIERLIREQGVDLVYTNTVTCVEGAIAAKRARKPHVWHIRENIRGNSELAPFLPVGVYCAGVASLSRAVVFNSRALAGDYPGLSGMAHVVHNGFSFPAPLDRPAARAEIIRELGLDDPSRLVTIVGALHPRKDHLTFLEAASRVSQERKETAYLIVGAGSDRYTEEVRRRIADLSLGSSVRLLGWRND
ncbi:MAG: glycosyl transferase, partial [Deltaproteobacteria bacterium]|nr:glycosyl transferase [Deltaproteobacteria bacterium]